VSGVQITHPCGHTNSRLICGCTPVFREEIKDPGPIDWGGFGLTGRDDQPPTSRRRGRRSR
jgi:hypothetical protein